MIRKYPPNAVFYPVGGESGIGNGESGSGNGGQGRPGFVPAAAGFVKSIRHEDGTFDTYDYSLVSNLWTRTITHLHEQSPSPVSGKTTRDITITNSRGEIFEEKTEAHIDGIWYTIAREAMNYNSQGKRIRSENLAGQVTTTAWDCCFAYANNTRSELINAVAAVDSDYRYAYDFDDIGNRETSSERGTNSVYTANQLNQYISISNSALSASPRETFTPQFDDDGNQTLIKTSTGIWSVTYNGENRPIHASEYTGKIVVCRSMMGENGFSPHGGCGCFMMHELMHKYGMVIPQDETHRLDIENAMIEIQRIVLRNVSNVVCRGYNVQ